jgi:hypothetical protein
VEKAVDDGSHKQRDNGCAKEPTGDEMLQENRKPCDARANGNAECEKDVFLCFFVHFLTPLEKSFQFPLYFTTKM